MGKWAKKLKGVMGGETTQRGENAQPLIDHWVIFSSLKQFVRFLLWIVYVPAYSVKYMHKNSECDISVMIPLLSSAI